MDILADLTGDEGIVTGKNLGGDSVAGERGDGFCRRLLGRIKECDVP